MSHGVIRGGRKECMGASGIPCFEVRVPCREPAPVRSFGVLRRGQANCVRRKVRGHLRRTAIQGDLNRFVERCSNVGICTDRAGSKMTCALHGIVNDSGQPPMNLPLVLWSRGSMHSRGIEWMGEANALPEQFHQSGVDRRTQTSRNLLLAKNGPEESDRRLRSRCRYE